jgi:hypothetical protein
LPDAFIDKEILLKTRLPLKTTSHSFKKSPRLKELQNNFQANNEVSEEKGNISLSSDDIEDIRTQTKRGMYLIGLITLKQTQNTQHTQTKNEATQNIRMSRKSIDALRAADEKKKRRIARVLAQLN